MSIYSTPNWTLPEIVDEQVRTHRWASASIESYSDPIPESIEYVEEVHHVVATVRARNGVIVAHLTTAGDEGRFVSLALDVPAHPLGPGSPTVPAMRHELRSVSHLRQALDRALCDLGSIERGTPSNPVY